MDIGSGKGNISSRLSNFTPRRFIFEGIECSSIEGVLQSFKFSEIDMQKYVCTLVGLKAKFKGKKKKWWRLQELYWNGVAYKRDGEEYQRLLNRLYQSVYDQCANFSKTLKASNNAVFTHSIGKSNSSETILTVREFWFQKNYFFLLSV